MVQTQRLSLILRCPSCLCAFADCLIDRLLPPTKRNVVGCCRCWRFGQERAGTLGGNQTRRAGIGI
jgi:hypothetical protein